MTPDAAHPGSAPEPIPDPTESSEPDDARRRRVPRIRRTIVVFVAAASAFAAIGCAPTPSARQAPTAAPTEVTPSVVYADVATSAGPNTTTSTTTVDVYAAAAAGRTIPAVGAARNLVYVPSNDDGTVAVIDQATRTEIARYTVGAQVQHVVPSHDLTRLYANASGANQLVPFDPVTGHPGRPINVDAPYNLYFTPDGARAVVMAERLRRIDYYDPVTWKRIKSLPVPCRGINHADWSADLTYFVATCEFSGQLLKLDTATGDIVQTLAMQAGAMPQDIRLSPDGSKFYVADMAHGGVWTLDGLTFAVTGFIATGVGAHGIYPSRDGKLLYVSNRGRAGGDTTRRSRPGEGSISVLDPTTDRVTATWTIPGGGSPDMGGVSADGTELWLSGRYDSVVYVFDTTSGRLSVTIPTVHAPHGLAVFPQPGRYSLGHTGNYR